MKSLNILQIPETEAQITDADLLSSIAQGDETALTALYDRYCRVLFGLIIRILRNHAEAEDVLQEVFVQVWQKAHNFDGERGKAFTWLMIITHSKAIDRLRFLKTRTCTIEKLKTSKLHYNDQEFEQNLILRQRRKHVRKALNQLPENQRSLLLMAYIEGYAQAEIAEQTNIPLGTVKTRMRIGMTKLRETLNVDSVSL